MVKKMLVVPALTAGLVVGCLAAPATAADAPVAKPVLAGLSAPDLVVKSASTLHDTIVAKLGNLPKGADPWLAVWSSDPDATVPSTYVPLYPSKDDPTLWGADVSLASTAATGVWGAEVQVYASTSSKARLILDDGADFYVRRATQNVVNASPEPAAHGTPITVKGTLTHYSPTAKKDTAYAAKQVDVYFDPTGSAPRTKVATVTTSSTGTYSKAFTAATSGVWSTQFAGTSNYAAVRSDGDYVPVVTRTTALTANATPEPVKKGGTVTVVGRLTHATTASGKLTYTSYKDKTLTISFNPTGPVGAKVVGTVTTNSQGEYSKTFTQSVDGTWWVSFAGTSNYASALKGDHVDVQ
jgi:hypothetical protein